MASEPERWAVIRALKNTRYPVIVELGAYHGEEYEWMLESLGPLGRYIAVEADPRAASVIAAKQLSLTLVQAAIARWDGHTTLFLCDNELDQAKASSSIRNPTGHVKHFPWCTFDYETEVPSLRLDTLFKDKSLERIDLLWVDIQGAERDMIAGGAEALKNTRFLMIEAEEVEFYEGQALKPELLKLLSDFEVIKDFGYNVFLKRRA